MGEIYGFLYAVTDGPDNGLSGVDGRTPVKMGVYGSDVKDWSKVVTDMNTQHPLIVFSKVGCVPCIQHWQVLRTNSLDILPVSAVIATRFPEFSEFIFPVDFLERPNQPCSPTTSHPRLK